ncbi:DUF7305 domain-containing protein [Paenibacillus solani]|uniref:DUF7305 domain-containing protein n=1 Tax=Paenibacillus solani TaxID=1705565 RepID=A0A0M1NZK6_9BACL|nr:pilus assembly PilX N-terminal domain-containing protein [Paenibacillus solani]KOR87698.1 hypothetical protein AM231_00120 [Paenibacillus solani]
MVKNERGLALPTVLILMTALTIIGLTLLGVGVSQAARTVHQEKKEQAFYIAKSGADAIASYIIDKYNPITLSEEGTIDKLNEDLNQDISLPLPSPGTFKVTLSDQKLNGIINTINITSVGKVGNVTDQVVLSLGLDGPVSKSDHAIFAFGNIDITNDSYGPPSKASVNNGNVAAEGNINGNLVFPVGGTATPSYTGVSPPKIPFINATSWTKQTLGSSINESGYYGDIMINNSKVFSINANSKEIHVVFGEMIINSSTTINVNGSTSTPDGIIHIYANSLRGTSSLTLNNTNNKNVIFHVKDNIDLVGSFNLGGALLYAPEAEYTATSGSLVLRGAMVVKNLAMLGDHVVNYDNKFTNLVIETLKYHRVQWSSQ